MKNVNLRAIVKFSGIALRWFLASETNGTLCESSRDLANGTGGTVNKQTINYRKYILNSYMNRLLGSSKSNSG